MSEETFEERKKRENEAYYKKWLECGFTGEMPINECGWFVPVFRLYYPVETIEVFNQKGYRASVEYCHLPNGKWVAASDLTCPLYGFGSACGVWDKQYDTKNEAIMNELCLIEKSLKEKDKKTFVLQAIQTCKNMFKESLFEMVFEPMAQFEQVSLF